ncbi:MAG: hypothetical protein FWF81_10025 [Defluviitaleaceae bacterium]|nr:hypothetical protein [Defluviitaleaceae bacterium]
MKKIILVFLLLSMGLLTAACGDDDSENGQLRIAVGYGEWESALGIQISETFEYLAEEFDVEIVEFLMGGGEDGLAAVESLLAGGGIDGIIAITWDVARQLTADRHQVPVVTALQFPSEAEIGSIAAFNTFLGGVIDDEFWAGYQAMRALYLSGSRNVTWSGLTTGFSQSHDDRTRGAMHFIAENPNMNLLAESYTMGLWHEDVIAFAAIFPEMDGMAFTSVNIGVYSMMEIEGIADGSVRIAGPDIAARTGEMFEKGVQVWSCGGQHATAMIGFAVLYNYLMDGTRIIPDPLTPIQRNYLEITSFEDYLEFAAVIESPLYSAQDIRQLIRYYNSAATFDDFVRGGREFSLDNIRMRRGN